MTSSKPGWPDRAGPVGCCTGPIADGLGGDAVWAAGGGIADGPGLYQDFCWTLTQMRVLALATFDQINVVAAAANQSSFMSGSLSVCEPGCAPDVPGVASWKIARA